MNFVPKKPMEAALAEALAGIALPAWVIDAPRGLIVRGNGRGNAVWGVPVMTPALDSAIPVLRSLRARLVASPRLAGLGAPAREPATEILQFRTAAGECAIRCTVRLLDDSVGRGLMLVVAEGEPDAGAVVAAERKVPPPTGPTAGFAAVEVAHSASAGWGPVLGRAPLPGGSNAGLHSGGNAGMPLSDAETLREIARRIRQGSAGVSNANDAPDERR